MDKNTAGMRKPVHPGEVLKQDVLEESRLDRERSC